MWTRDVLVPEGRSPGVQSLSPGEGTTGRLERVILYGRTLGGRTGAHWFSPASPMEGRPAPVGVRHPVRDPGHHQVFEPVRLLPVAEQVHVGRGPCGGLEHHGVSDAQGVTLPLALDTPVGLRLRRDAGVGTTGVDASQRPRGVNDNHEGVMVGTEGRESCRGRTGRARPVRETGEDGGTVRRSPEADLPSTDFRVGTTLGVPVPTPKRRGACGVRVQSTTRSKGTHDSWRVLTEPVPTDLFGDGRVPPRDGVLMGSSVTGSGVPPRPVHPPPLPSRDLSSGTGGRVGLARPKWCTDPPESRSSGASVRVRASGPGVGCPASAVSRRATGTSPSAGTATGAGRRLRVEGSPSTSVSWWTSPPQTLVRLDPGGVHLGCDRGRTGGPWGRRERTVEFEGRDWCRRESSTATGSAGLTGLSGPVRGLLGRPRPRPRWCGTGLTGLRSPVSDPTSTPPVDSSYRRVSTDVCGYTLRASVCVSVFGGVYACQVGVWTCVCAYTRVNGCASVRACVSVSARD